MDVAQKVIYLAGCAVNGIIPDKSRLEGADMAGLYSFAEAHMIPALTAFALESAGINYRPFTQAKAKALGKAVIFDSERRTVSDRLELEGIWHLPMKGAVIAGCYPVFGMRQSGDIDILFDTSRISDVRRIMKELGFFLEDLYNLHHDVFVKKPVTCIEMHHNVFDSWKYPSESKYYENVKERLVLEDGKKYTYRFTNEDAYVYMTAHAHAHYSTSGTGLRTVIDTYMYLKKFSGSMDWEYIQRELRKLGISEFEENMRSISAKLFEGGELSEKEKVMAEYITVSGVYGTAENLMKHKLINRYGGSKVKFLLREIFPPLSDLKHRAPFIWKHKYLYPVYLIKRIMRVTFKSPGKIAACLKLCLRRGK